MNELTGLTPLAAVTAYKNNAEAWLSTFLAFVDAIPKDSPLRDSSGMLRPNYSDARDTFNAGQLWSTVAGITQAAVSKLTIHTRDSVTCVQADRDAAVAALRDALVQSANHEKALRAFASQAETLFEQLTGGMRGFTDFEDIYNFNVRNEIKAAYLLHLKPDWLSLDDYQKCGCTIIIAMHLADKILRRKNSTQEPTGTTGSVDNEHPVRVLATLRLLAEFRAQQEQITLLPNNDDILHRYTNFEFSFEAGSAIMEEAICKAQAVHVANVANAEPGVRTQALGEIFSEKYSQLASEYRQAHMPQTVADIPDAMRQGIVASIFSQRLDNQLSGMLDTSVMATEIEAMMKCGSFAQRLTELSKLPLSPEQPVSPVVRLFSPPDVNL